MAKRIRDHKAEYQRRKQLAAEAGSKSVRDYKRTRKTLGLPRTEKLTASRYRKESKEWSDKHSRLTTSRYNPRMSDSDVLEYHAAFVRSYEKRENKLDALYRYLVGNDIVSEAEWEQNYLPQN